MTDDERDKKLQDMMARNKRLKNKKSESELKRDAQIRTIRKDLRTNDTIAGIFAICLQVANFFEVAEYLRED